MTENDVNRKKATTALGEVEYETVVCDSCDSEVIRDEAYRFLVFDEDAVREEYDWHKSHQWEISHGGYTTGWACPYCRGEGPVAFPAFENDGRMGEIAIITIMTLLYWLIFTVVFIL